MWSQFLSSSGPQSRGREEIDSGMSSTLPEMISSLTDGKKECGQMRKITVTAPSYGVFIRGHVFHYPLFT